MTFLYDGDPSASDVEAVRFYLQDTDASNPIFSDEEIQFYVDQLALVYGSNLATASYLADVAASKYAREVAISADGVTVGADQLSAKYHQLAEQLREQWRQVTGAGGGPDVGGILWGEEPDPTVKLTWAGIGMHDNDRVGRQDYGGSIVDERMAWGDW